LARPSVAERSKNHRKVTPGYIAGYTGKNFEMGLRDSRNRDCLLFCAIPMQMARKAP
jgi:hypothetical protein